MKDKRLEELINNVNKAKEYWCVDQQEWEEDWKPIDDLIEYVKENYLKEE